MSRGLGKTQRDILHWLHLPDGSWMHTHGIGGLYFLMYRGDPTEANLRSCRRALARLIESGVIEDGYRTRADGTRLRQRYVRLTTSASKALTR